MKKKKENPADKKEFVLFDMDRQWLGVSVECYLTADNLLKTHIPLVH